MSLFCIPAGGMSIRESLGKFDQDFQHALINFRRSKEEKTMTMPSAHTRAVVLTWEFLRSLRTLPDVPDKLRHNNPQRLATKKRVGNLFVRTANNLAED